MHTQMHPSQQRHIIQKMDIEISHTLRHTHKWDRHANGHPSGQREGFPSGQRARSPSITPLLHPPDPCHTQSASQSNTQLSPSVGNSYHPLRQSVCHSHTSTYTHTETWRVPCLTPGPRWSLVWRSVCVCLASNGPFKCRIFTADKAILGDCAH